MGKWGTHAGFCPAKPPSMVQRPHPAVKNVCPTAHNTQQRVSEESEKCPAQRTFPVRGAGFTDMGEGLGISKQGTPPRLGA